MKFDLPTMRPGLKSANLVDGRGQTVFVGGATRVAELLYALPMVKGDALALSATDLAVLTRKTVSAMTAVPYVAATLLNAVSGLGAETPLKLARIGIRLEDLVIDDRVTAKDTGHQDLYWKTAAGGVAVLRELDTQIARGTGTSPNMAGLSTLVTRTAAAKTPADVEYDVRLALASINPNGSGPGDGPHCLIGNALLLRKLMQLASGQRGTSGWRHDPRSGLVVYHYMGIPFYRADVATSANLTTLYAANLGPTGLNLVHAYGTPASFGLAVDPIPGPQGQAVHDVAVHGAWALALWELEAAFSITSVDVTTTGL